MYETYIEKHYTYPDKAHIINEAIEYHTTEQERRNEELFRFIDEFVASEEYEDYLKRKRNLRCKQVSTQYKETDCVKTEKQEMKEKYPLTMYSRKMMYFAEQFKRYTENEIHQHTLQSQEKGIQMIKDKIAEVKRAAAMQQLYKSKKDKEKQYAKYIDEFCDKYNVALLTLENEARKKATDKIICYQKLQRSRYRKSKNNILNFIRKMVREDDRQKKIDKELKKTYDYKVKRKERIIKGMEIVGEKIILKPRYPEPEPPEIPEPTIIEPEEGKKKKDIKSKPEKPKKGDKKNKKDKKDKSSQKSKKSKPSKGGKKSKKSKEVPLILPNFPVCSDRERVKVDVTGKMADLIKEFKIFNEMLENRHIMLDPRNIDNIPECRNELVFVPSVLYFEHFKSGCVYSRRLKILNASPQRQKFRMFRLITPNEYDTLLFEIKPLLEIKVLPSGCSVTLNVIFHPDYDHMPLQGKLIFIKYNLKTLTYEKFSINIHCIPIHAHLRISCRNVNFGKIPKWRMHEDNRKVVKFTNDGSRTCKLVIKKIVCHETEDTEDFTNSDDAHTVAEGLVESLINNVFNYFQLEHTFLILQPYEYVNVNVTLKNTEYAGIYFGKYCVDVYEENHGEQHVGSQELFFHAEITGHFIVVAPEVLDFGVCSTESVHQLSLDIFNRSPATHSLSIRFPSSVSSYISTDVSNIYISGDSRRTIWVRLLPRRDIFERPPSYFDSKNNILEFPIRIYVVSKNYFNAPPVQATVYAVLLNQHNLTIIPMSEYLTVYRTNEAVLNLGECSLFETVSTQFLIQNNTALPQMYGFFNVPQSVTIFPNYGFGELQVGESRVLQLFYHPDENDAVKYQNGKQIVEYQKNIILKLDTVNNMKVLKKEFNNKRLRESFAMVMREMKKSVNYNLLDDIKDCVSAIKCAWFPEKTDIDVLYERYPGEFGETRERRQTSQSIEPSKKYRTGVYLTLQAKIVRPLVELSSQYIRFSNTPCFSYSIVEIEITAITNEFATTKQSNKLPAYEAFFRITGDNADIKVEPSCGVLKNGEKKNIILIAKPTVPEEVILTTARMIRYNEIYERKKQEYEDQKIKKSLKKGKQDKKKGKKDKDGSKKDKTKKGSPKKEKPKDKKSHKKYNSEASESNPEPEIIVNDAEIVIDYLDIFPAEMFYWRSVEPYEISSKLMCTINYRSEEMYKNTDVLYLNAHCTVVKPDFTINLKLQRLDFGDVAIGMSSIEYIIIQNIQYSNIEIRYNLLNPVGVFSIPYVKSLKVPPEYFIKLPLKFEPKEDTKISNSTQCKISTTFQKLVEISGYMKELPKKEVALEKKGKDDGKSKGSKKDKESQKSKDKKSKTDKSSKKSKKSRGKKKVEKISQNLTEIEEYSIPFFEKTKGAPHFDLLLEENRYCVEAHSTKSVTLVFGNPKAILEKKKELKEREANKGKGKGKGIDKGKKKRNKSKSTGSSKAKSTEPMKYYVAKYNICLQQEFLRDVILIGSFK
ncbi:unnamed protein product [Callosobruchus maculatus]|uniref:Uncharacterized protein n=1 Tax=Callosobruchus maculatus TaxID=64391 RepID=A0A653DRA0_CALMS|nr:unnamed protein product [Callosobruchus maculatus]